jgi:hypothetical protein
MSSNGFQSDPAMRKTQPNRVSNPLEMADPQLVKRLQVLSDRVVEVLLDRLAADSLKDDTFRPESRTVPIDELKANVQILRMLTKETWNQDDLRLFDTFWRQACLSDLFAEEFEAERHRIVAAVTSARQRLDDQRAHAKPQPGHLF